MGGRKKGLGREGREEEEGFGEEEVEERDGEGGEMEG